MAHHWHSAHDSARALIAAWQAAAQAGRAVAPAERLSLLARVLELWDQVPDAAMRIGADHVYVLEEATSAAHDAGEFERGIALATSALKELDPATEPVRVAQLLENRGHFRMRLGRKDFGQDLEDALAYVPADVSPATRIKIMLSLARCAPRVSQERSYAEEALVLARQSGDEANEANALLSLAMFDAASGQQAASGSGPLELIAQARAMAERRGADGVLLHAAVNESHLLEGAGEHELAAEAARRATVSADAQRLSRTSGSLLAINEAEPLFSLGRWDEALKIATEAMDLYLAPGPLHRSMLQVLAGCITLARGDQAAAAQSVLAARDALRSARYEDQHQLPLARLEILLALDVDGPAAAIAAASATMDRFDLSGGSPRYAWPVVIAGASAVLAAVRQAGVAHDERLRDEAAALADRLRTVAEKLEAFGPVQRAFQLTFTAADAHVAQLLAAFPGAGYPGISGSPGQADGADGEPTELLAAWDQAVAAWAALSEPYPLARTLLHTAEAALACGDRGSAAERLRRAGPLAAGLGAQPLSEQIAVLARRARIRLAGQDGDEAGPDDGALALTVRELDVLRLVAAGRSNRKIAAELFISPKTASVHVSNILAKLGAASRGEAAAKAHALRLFEPPGP